MIYFISGHRNITKECFDKFYVPIIKLVINNDPNFRFVVAECKGVDSMAQDFLNNTLSEEDKSKVTVYHMFTSPRYISSDKFKLSGGYMSDIERDAAMTNNSDFDIAFVQENRWESGTAQNIQRRHEI